MINKPICHRLAVLSITTLVGWVAPLVHSQNALRPNVMVILSDDIGYSNLGCYASEIKTPTLDRLAANSLRDTRFYNTSLCGPTRASLLTGLYAHQAGVGEMTQDGKLPGYDGKLWPEFREVQLGILKTPLTSVANTIDLGDEKNIHPADKAPICVRLALLARRDVYGEKIVAQGPVFKSAMVKRQSHGD